MVIADRMRELAKEVFGGSLTSLVYAQQAIVGQIVQAEIIAEAIRDRKNDESAMD